MCVISHFNKKLKWQVRISWASYCVGYSDALRKYGQVKGMYINIYMPFTDLLLCSCET